MSQRNLLNLILAVAAIALALFVYLKPGQAPDTRIQVGQLDTDTVTTVHLTRQQAVPLVFNKHDDRWLIDGEPILPANNFQVDTILALAKATTGRHYPADTLDLATMGLQPPLASALLNDERFDVGITESLNSRRYVLHDNTVYLVQDRYQHLLNAGRTNFIERKLLPQDAVITALSLPDTTLFLTNDNHWQLQPSDPAMAADTLKALIARWENSNALYVRDYDGSSGEAISLTLQDNEEPIEFLLLAVEPDVVLARPEWGIQYHLTAESGLNLITLPKTADP